MKVFISGAAGRLGRKLIPALEGQHDLVLGDVRPLDDARFVPLDVQDLAAVRVAVRDCDAVVHMAILDWGNCTREELLRHAVPALQVHVIGVHNMLRAAWETGVRRFVHISTVSVVDGLPPDVMVTSDTRPCSNKLYGMTKGFGEDVCRQFHHTYGLPVAVLRLGTIFIPDGRGCWLGSVHYPDMTKQRLPGPAPACVHVDDVTRLIALALVAPEPNYSLVHVVGDNPGRQWDLEAARRMYGWEPRYVFGVDSLPLPAPRQA